MFRSIRFKSLFLSRSIVTPRTPTKDAPPTFPRLETIGFKNLPNPCPSPDRTKAAPGSTSSSSVASEFLSTASLSFWILASKLFRSPDRSIISLPFISSIKASALFPKCSLNASVNFATPSDRVISFWPSRIFPSAFQLKLSRSPLVAISAASRKDSGRISRNAMLIFCPRPIKILPTPAQTSPSLSKAMIPMNILGIVPSPEIKPAIKPRNPFTKKLINPFPAIKSPSFIIDGIAPCLKASPNIAKKRPTAAPYPARSIVFIFSKTGNKSELINGAIPTKNPVNLSPIPFIKSLERSKDAAFFSKISA